MADLQILIAAYGPDAMERIASLSHPEFPGVEYIVGWQKADLKRIPEDFRTRNDFRIIPLETVGLCNNRNALIDVATAPTALISDDDIIYKENHLKNILESFKDRPDSHILTFRYTSDSYPKNYPTHSFNLKQPPKGYFVTSMEIGLNLKMIREDFGSLTDIYFHPAFGINGSLFGSGEEDLLIHSLLNKGYKGIFIPVDICHNTESTTSDRISNTREFIETRGAVFYNIKPYSWPLRMLTHAQRSVIPFMTYCKWWLSGISKARREKVFK